MAEVQRLQRMVDFLTSRLRRYEPDIEQQLTAYASLVVAPAKPKWQSVSESYLAKVPLAEHWKQRQYELGLADPPSYEKIILLMTKHDGRDLTIGFRPTYAGPEENNLVDVLEAYAITTRATYEAAKFATALSLFRGLILSSLCAVLEASATLPVEQIDGILRRGLESTANVYDLKRTRRAAVFVNGLINDLAQSDWTIQRATELFFLSSQSIHQYRKMIPDDCRRYLLTKLTEDRFVRHDFKDCLRVAYTIPGLICTLAPGLSPDLVWRTLGYPNPISDNPLKVQNRSCMGDLAAGKFTIQHWSPLSLVSDPLFLRCGEELAIFDSRLGFLRGLGHSLPTLRLLLILLFLGGIRIPRTILTRGCEPRQRWDNNGRIAVVTPLEAGLDPDIIAILSNEPVLDQIVEALAANSLLARSLSTDGCQMFTLDVALQENLLRGLGRQEKDAWDFQAWRLGCHAYFGGPSLENLDNTTIQMHRSHLQHLVSKHELDYYPNLPPQIKIDLVATLLMTSVCSPQAWKERAIFLGRHIVQDIPRCYLHLWAERCEVQLRSMPMQWSHIQQLRDSFSFPAGLSQGNFRSVDRRAYAQYGRFLVSNADRCLRRNEVAQAKLMLDDWAPPHADTLPPLILKAVLLWKFTMAKAYRYEGNFAMALQLLQDAWENYRHVQGFHNIQGRLCHHIGDVRCELGQYQAASEFLELQVAHCHDSGHVAQANALLVPLAEAVIQGGDLVRAEGILSNVSNFYGGLDNPSEVAKLAHIRTHLGLARIATMREQWHRSLVLWSTALTLTQEYGWGLGFTCGVINLSVSYVTARIGELETSQRAKQLGREMLDRVGWKNYWLAMIATHWRGYLHLI